MSEWSRSDSGDEPTVVYGAIVEESPSPQVGDEEEKENYCGGATPDWECDKARAVEESVSPRLLGSRGSPASEVSGLSPAVVDENSESESDEEIIDDSEESESACLKAENEKIAESESTKPLETEPLKTIETNSDAEPRKSMEDLEEAVRLFTSPKCPSLGSSTIRLQAGLDEMLSEQTAQSRDDSQEMERESEYHSTCNPSPPVYERPPDPPTERHGDQKLQDSCVHLRRELMTANEDYQRLVQDRERLYEELHAAHEQLETMLTVEHRCIMLKESLESATSQLREAEQFSDDCLRRERERVEEVRELQTSQAAALSEITTLREQLHDARAQIDETNSVHLLMAQVQADLDKARQQLSDANEELAHLKNCKSEIVQLRDLLGQASEELNELKQRAEASGAETMVAIAERDRLREELDHVKRKMRDAIDEAASKSVAREEEHGKEVKALQEKLAAALSAKLEQAKELAVLRSRAEVETAEAKRAAAQKYETECVRAEGRRQVESLERRLLTLNRSIIDLEVENSQKGLKIQELMKANDALEAELRAADLAAQQKQQTRSVLDTLLGRW